MATVQILKDSLGLNLAVRVVDGEVSREPPVGWTVSGAWERPGESGSEALAWAKRRLRQVGLRRKVVRRLLGK